MKLLFFTEARLIQTSDKKFYSANQSFSFLMFKRYLKTFNNVLIVARVAVAGPHDTIDEDTRIDINGIIVLPLPYYVGPFQYLVKRNKLVRTLYHYINLYSEAAIICRVPGTIGTIAARYLFGKKRPYGVEVVGDPYEVFAPGSFNHPLSPIFRYRGVKSLQDIVKKASAAIYVTKETLQARYPADDKTFSIHASNVMLPPEAFVFEAKQLKNTFPFSIVSVGTLATLYKSPDIAIEAVAILKKRGLLVSFKWLWLGDGKYRGEMETLAKQTGVSDSITFLGNIGSAHEVRAYLDTGDLFVLPSRTEGLPRALVEGMARGLPCIGTNIGGIPELLDREALVPINNAEKLAEKIEYFFSTPTFSKNQEKRNFKEAKNYALDILEVRRTKFYEHLKEIS